MKREKSLRDVLRGSPLRVGWVAKKLKLTTSYLRMIVCGARPLPEDKVAECALIFDCTQKSIREAAAESVRQYQRGRNGR